MGKCWTVSYPWKKEPGDLPNNVKSAVCRLASTEKRLQRVGANYGNAYHNQIMDMLNRNVARKLSETELNEYDGPIHYVAHHEVLKPDSKSTPIRIVFNSSASYMGHVLNDYWVKRPNVLNDLLTVLIRFRQGRVAIAGDISKMYNAIRLSVLDQHTHRFVWRNLDTERTPDHYTLLSVTFGDRPSGAIATVALRMTAEMCKEIYPIASEIIMRNSYVDDLLTSVDDVQDARQIIDETEKLLDYGGFKIKNWIISGDESEWQRGLHISRESQEKILGMIWQPKEDVFTFKAKINFSTKQRGVRTGKDLHKSQIDHIPKNLTRRMVLSQVSSIYDPLGLVTPFVLSAKVLMRSLCKNRENGEGWDDPMSEEMRQNWIDFFRGVFELESLKFPRCVKPDGAQGDPMLIIFADGSSIAYGTCAYIRWQTGTGVYDARLLIAKNSSAVLASRLSEKLVKEMDFYFTKVIHIVDSTIVRAQIQKESYGFGTFVATRIAEIQSKTEPSDWWWVPGDNNPADLTTRVTSPTSLSMGSVWQKGPKFLRLPLEQWPIRQENIDSGQLPDVISITLSVEDLIPSFRTVPDFCDIDISRFSSLNKLMHVSSIILKIAETRTFRGAANKITSETLRRSELVWIRSMQKELPADSLNRFRRLGAAINQDGIFTVGQRMKEWIMDTWNQTEFVLLPKNKFVELIVRSYHNEGHFGVDATLAKIRSRYWIPGVRRIIKLIKKRCVVCRKREKIMAGQQMGILPIERMLPAPAFYYCAVDLFGPFVIRDTVKRRTHGKAYGVLFNCLTSRAVYVDLAEGYDTSSFIIVLRRFVSIKGYPRKMISDSGTQLVATAKELKQVMHTWDWNWIKSFGIEKGMDWVVSKAADAPWENGRSESPIKSVKKCIEIAIGSSILAFSELQTVLFEVSNLLNERPIGTKNCYPNEGSYLCPNDLLLGRASSRVPSGKLSMDCEPRIRWKFVEEMES